MNFMPTNKKILHFDLDGVIVDFDHQINYHIDLYKHDVEGKERGRIVDEICAINPHIFHSPKPIEGAIETVNLLFDLYDVYFLSTPMWDVPQSFMDKRIWLERHFGDKCHKRLILTHRKDLVIGDYLVDDRTKNGAGEFKGMHIHFGTEVFPNWETVYNFLLKEK